MSATLEIPEDRLGALGTTPSTVAGELQLLAAMKLFELGRISWGAATALADIARVEFRSKLGDYGVSPFQLGLMISSAPSKSRVAPHAIDRARTAIVIADTSPLQCVFRSGIEILPGLFGAVLVPEAVRDELLPPTPAHAAVRGRRVADCSLPTTQKRVGLDAVIRGIGYVRKAMFAGGRMDTQLRAGDGGRYDE